MAERLHQQDALVRLNTISPADEVFASRNLTLTTDTNTVVIGRTSKRRLSLEASATNAFYDCPVMSRNHAELKLDSDKQRVLLRDVGSLHGTLHNRLRLRDDETRVLKDGDIITFGMPIDRGAERFIPYEVEASITWKNAEPMGKPVTYRVPDESDVEEEISSEEDNSTAYARKVMRENNFVPSWVQEPIDLTNNDDDVEVARPPMAPLGVRERPKPIQDDGLFVDLTASEQIPVEDLGDTDNEPPEEHSAKISDDHAVTLLDAYNYDDDDYEEAFDSDFQYPSGTSSECEDPDDEVSSVGATDADSDSMVDDADRTFPDSVSPYQAEFGMSFKPADGSVAMSVFPTPNLHPELSGDQSLFDQPEVSNSALEDTYTGVRPYGSEWPSGPSDAQREPPATFPMNTSAESHVFTGIALAPIMTNGHATQDVAPVNYPTAQQEATPTRIMHTDTLIGIVPGQTAEKDALGQKAEKAEYFQAREENRRILGLPVATTLDKPSPDAGNGDLHAHRLGEEMFPLPRSFYYQAGTGKPNDLAESGSRFLNAPLSDDLMPEIRARAKSPVLDDTSAYQFEMSKKAAAECKETELPQPSQPFAEAAAQTSPQTTPLSQKRKADEISKSTPEEEEIASVLPSTDLEGDGQPRHTDGVPSRETTKCMQFSFAGVKNRTSSSEDRRPTKRLRRVAEVFGYAAIGGIAVMSALIATAPEL